jgi:hypothetical protein
MSIKPPPPLGDNWKSWGERIVSYLSTNKDKLSSITSGESASEDGILMWDRALGTLVVSKNGAWVKVKLDP